MHYLITIFKRALTYVNKCLKSSSTVVNFGARYGAYYECMDSVLGSNIQNGAEYLNLHISDLLNDRLCSRLVNHIGKIRRTA